MTEAFGKTREEASRRLSTAVAVGLLCASVGAFAIRYHFARPTEDRELARATSTVVERIRTRHAAWAEEVAKVSPTGSCAGAERAAMRGLDSDAGGSVLELLERMRKSCPKLSSVAGLRAEARARSGQPGAELDASRALQALPADPHALYARAFLAWRAHSPEAMSFAERAVEARRGPSASLLQGLIAYDAGKLDVAAQAFRAAIAQERDNVQALYNLALVEQRKGDYLRAREGYLAVLRVEPDHTDARFNLGILAHSIGARAEAAHHLAKLRATAKDPAKVARLEATLLEPAPSRAMATSAHYSLVRDASRTANRPVTEPGRSPTP